MTRGNNFDIKYFLRFCYCNNNLYHTDILVLEETN